MGQVYGRAPLPPTGSKFINLPRSSVYGLWEAWSDVAEGYALSIDEFYDILKVATMKHIQFDDKTLFSEVDALFRVYDSDNNRLVDSIEFISSLAMISGMTPEEKLCFLFAMFDFEETGSLSMQEIILAFRSSCSGLSKLCHIEPPADDMIESIIIIAFKLYNTSGRLRLDRDTFISLCMNTAEILSWIEYFEDVEEFAYVTSSKNIDIIIDDRHDHHDHDIKAPTPLDLNFQSKSQREQSLPWEKVIPHLVNSRLSDNAPVPPQENFMMDWVYGYNSSPSCQNVYYSHRGEVIYPAGAIVILQNIYEHRQRQFIHHHGIVSCLKLYHTDDDNNDNARHTIIASGEQGNKPCIHIWDGASLSIMSTLQGFHQVGIKQVDFSPDHKHLVSLGMDAYHSIAVYNWLTRERLYSSRSTLDPVHDIRILTGNIFATCGYNHIYFWKESSSLTSSNRSIYCRYRGIFGSNTSSYDMRCVSMIGQYIVSGSNHGMMHIWDGRNLVRSIKAHDDNSIVYAMYTVDQGKEHALVTACDHGKIIIWNKKMEMTATFHQPDIHIISICWNLITSKLLISSLSGKIYEINAIDGKISPTHHTQSNDGMIVHAHSSNMISGLAVHPFIPHFLCTTSTDEHINIYHALSHHVHQSKNLGASGSCVCYSPDGQLILVGIGLSSRKAGAYMILSEENLVTIHEAHDCKKCINDCKFTPDGTSYLLAGDDACIYVYRTAGYELIAHLHGHVSSIIHIDISVDSKHIMSNDDTGHLYFWNIIDGEVVPADIMREVIWSSNTCVYSFATQKIWSSSSENHTYYTVAARSYGGNLMAATNNHGEVRIYNAPCLKDDPPYIVLHGHAASAMNCHFTCNDNHLFTTGSHDGCLIQWRCILPSSSPATFNHPHYIKPEEVSMHDELMMEIQFEGNILDHNIEFNDAIQCLPTAICEYEESAGEIAEEYMPWQKIIVGPSNPPVENLSEPADSLEMDYIYGFTVDRTRASLYYAPTKEQEAVFISAGLVVIMDRKKRTQRFYASHQSTITAITVSMAVGMIATGDMAESPTIRVWDPNTLLTISILIGYHTRAIIHLDFDESGKKLVSVGQDHFHSIAVYDWMNQQIICCCQSFINKSFFIHFLSSNDGFIHGGQHIISFYDIHGSNIHCHQPVGIPTHQAGASIASYLCCEQLGSHIFVGGDDGNIYHFHGKLLDGVIQAHTGAINSITTSRSSTSSCICTGSTDGYLKIWSYTTTNTLECILAIDAIASLTCSSNNIRIVCGSSISSHILVATSHAEIYEISSKTGLSIHTFTIAEDYTTSAILAGHGGDELWGLAINPMKNNEFCSVGDDAILRVWDTNSHHTMMMIPLELPARACCYSPDGKVIAIGCGCPRKVRPKQYDGKWMILDTTSWQITYEARDSKAWITEMKYSPSGEFLAMGAFDNKIYVYNAYQAYALSAVISHHNSYITALDFSEDGAWLQSNSHDHELCYFETDTGIYIPAASRLRDTNWMTQNCYMSWSVQGLWTPYKDGREPTTTESNFSHPPVTALADDDNNNGNHDYEMLNKAAPILISGDNYGRIQVHRYPCSSSHAHSKLYRISSYPVTRIRMLGAGYLPSDSRVLAVIGKDKIIIQYKHHHDTSKDVASNSGTITIDHHIEEEADDVIDYFRPVSSFSHPVCQLHPKPMAGPIILSPSLPVMKQILPLKLTQSQIIGLQANHTRQAVYYGHGSTGSNSSIICPSSRYIHVTDIHLQTQHLYTGHHHEVTCMTISADKQYVASAEDILRVCIHIWDSMTGMMIIQLPASHRHGVACMQFSSYHNYRLISLGKDIDYSIAIWESCTGSWQDGILLATARGDVSPVLFTSWLSYNHHDDKLSPSYHFVTGGRNHVKFWHVEGRCCNPVYPILPADLQLGTMLCGREVTASSSPASSSTIRKAFISGSTSGHVYIWKGRHCICVSRAHEGGVSCIYSASDIIVTGSKDGSVKIWKLVVSDSSTADNMIMTLECLSSYHLRNADIIPVSLPIRSVDGIVSSGKHAHIIRLLLTTAGGEIYELATQSGAITTLYEAHNHGELYGLCPHPIDPDLFATCGDDRTVRLWSISIGGVVRKAILEASARAITWSNDGLWLVIGMGGDCKGRKQRKDGAFLILDASSLQPIFEGRDSKQPICCVSFSPNTSSLAIGSMDGYVYIYTTTPSYRLRGKALVHNIVHHIEYSIDNHYIRVYTVIGDIYYLEVEDGMIMNKDDNHDIINDIQWKDESLSVYDKHASGIWPTGDHDPDIQHYPTCIHKKVNIIAVGMQGGDIAVYPNPCQYISPSLSLTSSAASTMPPLISIPQAHAGSIAQIRFTADMRFMLTIGQYDRAINIWKVTTDGKLLGSPESKKLILPN